MNVQQILKAFCVCFLNAGAIFSQVNAASLTGLVKDSSDALI